MGRFPSRGHRSGDPWAFCDRCRWRWRLSQLAMQNGLLLCTHCFDSTVELLRERNIRDVLTDGVIEAENVTALVRQEPGIVEEQS